MTKTAFLLTAGFGTRFKPHTNFLPKPALPFFNLPQALYPAGLLKEIGVSDFHYNSHHLHNELDTALSPYFKRGSLFEKDILDSGGGISNARDVLSNEDHFWVVNGDSFITAPDSSILTEAYDFHIKTNSIATLIGIKKAAPSMNGLARNSDNILTHTEKGSDSLHFIGLYIFSKEIFKYLKTGSSHILKDALLSPDFKEKVSVFNAQEKITWFETGNEADFIECHKIETAKVLAEKENSAAYRTHKTWGNEPSKLLEQFLLNQVWGSKLTGKHESEFLILPENFQGEINNLKNCVVLKGVTPPSSHDFENRVLIDSSQWT